MKNILICKSAPLSDPRWKTCENFKCKGSFVNAEGEKLAKDFRGKCFQIFEKQRCVLTRCERAKRVLGGSVCVVATLGLFLLSRKIRGLFSKNYVSVYLAKPVCITDKKKEKPFYGLDLFDETAPYFDGTQNWKLSLKAVAENGGSKIYPFIESSSGSVEKIEENTIDWILAFFASNPDQNSLTTFWDHPLTSDEDRTSFAFELLMKKGKLLEVSLQNEDLFIKILKLIQEKKLATHFNEMNEQGQSLWKQWGLSGHFEIVSLMLATEPDLITHIRDLPESALIHSLIQKNVSCLSLFFEAMFLKKVPFSSEEEWLTIFITNPKFLKREAFNQLDPNMQNKVWAAAQFFGYRDVIEHLKNLGMGRSKKLLQDPEIYPKYTDKLSAQKAVTAFVKALKSEKKILSYEEAQILDFSSYKSHENGFDKVQAYDYFCKICDRTGLFSIEPVETFAALEKDQASLSLFLEAGQKLIADEDQPIKVYSKQIQGAKRTLSIQEADHLAAFLILSRVKTSSVCITKDKIAIDASSFDEILEHPDFESIELYLKQHTSLEDHPELLSILDRFKNMYLEERQEWEAKLLSLEVYEKPWDEFFNFEGSLKVDVQFSTFTS